MVVLAMVAAGAENGRRQHWRRKPDTVLSIQRPDGALFNKLIGRDERCVAAANERHSVAEERLLFLRQDGGSRSRIQYRLVDQNTEP